MLERSCETNCNQADCFEKDFLLFPMTNKVMSQNEQKEMLQPFMDVDERLGNETLQLHCDFSEEISDATK